MFAGETPTAEQTPSVALSVGRPRPGRGWQRPLNPLKGEGSPQDGTETSSGLTKCPCPSVGAGRGQGRG